MKSKNDKPLNISQTVIVSICAAVLLVAANSAIWLNRYIFDSKEFSKVATTSITSESSRYAIASELTDRALEKRPVVNSVLNDDISRLLSGFLGTEQATNVLGKTIERLHVFFTSSDSEPVVINFAGLKNTLGKVIDTFGNPEDPAIDPDEIPDEIVLLDNDQAPNFYSYGVMFLWVGPIAFLGALALLAFPYFKWRDQYQKTLAIQGAAVVGAGLMALLVGPLFRPPFLSNFDTSNGRTLVSNLYDAFTATFNGQTAVLILAGVFALLASGAIFFVKTYRTK